MRMKISPKHCKIFSSCDLGTKTLWQSSLRLLLAWSCGKYQARRAVVNKPSHWELWRVFNNQMKMLIIFRNMCQPIKFIILWILKIKCMLLLALFKVQCFFRGCWSLSSTYQQWTLFCLNGPYFGPKFGKWKSINVMKMGTSDQYKVFDSILEWSPTPWVVLGPLGVPILLKSVFLETPCSL